MRLSGFFISDDHTAQFRRCKPMRREAAQNACLALDGAARHRPSASLARDDKDNPIAPGLRPMQKPDERVVRLMLTHAMQIDHAIDLRAATQQVLIQTAFEPGERRDRRRRPRRRRAGREERRLRRRRSDRRRGRARWKGDARPRRDIARDLDPERDFLV